MRLVRGEQVQQDPLLLGNATGTGKGVPMAYGVRRPRGPRRGNNHATGREDDVAPAHARVRARAVEWR